MLSIEVTRECPLSCPGCYAYGDSHLGEGGPNLRSVSDYRGRDLVISGLLCFARGVPRSNRPPPRIVNGLYPAAWTNLPKVSEALSELKISRDGA